MHLESKVYKCIGLNKILARMSEYIPTSAAIIDVCFFFLSHFRICQVNIANCLSQLGIH